MPWSPTLAPPLSRCPSPPVLFDISDGSEGHPKHTVQKTNDRLGDRSSA